MLQLNLNNLKKTWDQLLAHWRSQHRLPGLVGINFSDDGFALAHVIRNVSAKPSVQVCDFIPCTRENFAQKLEEAVSLHHLKGAACSWVLNRSDYHLLLIDKPHVPKDELQSAIQWLIKDLIDFPAREAAVDFFDIPETIMHDPKKIFVVVAQKSKLQATVACIDGAGLRLASIDINAFALRNLGAILAEKQQDIALLHLEQDSCSMVVLSQLFLCLIRQINVTLADFDQEGVNTQAVEENLLEEIKRTIDYCNQQMAHVLPNKIFLLPVSEQYKKISQYLCKELGILMQEVDFNALLEIPAHLDQKMLARCSTALCGALRQEEIS